MGTVSKPGTPARILVFEVPTTHPDREGTYKDEFGNTNSVCIDPGGEGTRIIRSLKIGVMGMHYLVRADPHDVLELAPGATTYRVL
jgi:hypothetical protein